MKEFQVFLESIADPSKSERIEEILRFIKEKFPHLKGEIKWNQPMFSDHGTFIIGFSIAAGHISVAPEAAAVDLFENDIRAAGYSHTKEIFRIKWADSTDFDLLYKIVAFNIEDKKDINYYWRR